MPSPDLKPTPEHDWLRLHIGAWDVECEMHHAPNAPPMAYPARDVVKEVGAYWVASDFTALMGGQTYRGMATMGFDPVGRRFLSTWVDSMGPFMTHFEGERDAAGRLQWKQVGESLFGPGTRFEAEEEHEDDDHRSFRMWLRLADGSQRPMLRYRYRRAGGGA